MTERSRRIGVVAAVLLGTLAIATLGYWLGRGSAKHESAKPEHQTAVRTVASAPPTALSPVEKLRTPAAEKTNDTLNAAEIAPKWRFAGISSYRVASDTESWMSLYADHHDLIVRFNQRYPYAWNVSSAEEIAWLAKNGFPMPEDMIAADAMSDDDLRREADAGSSKALMLYYERLQSEWITAARDEISKGASPSDADQRAAIAIPKTHLEIGRISSQVRGMETPFFGYLEANQPLLVDDETAREQNLAGGLALAYARGDDRAGMAVLSTAANGALSEEQAALAYRIMAETRDYYPVRSACDPRISTPFPKPPPEQ